MAYGRWPMAYGLWPVAGDDRIGCLFALLPVFGYSGHNSPRSALTVIK